MTERKADDATARAADLAGDHPARAPLTPDELAAVYDAASELEQVNAIMARRSVSYVEAYNLMADAFGASR